MSLVISTKSPNYVSDTTVLRKSSRYFDLDDTKPFDRKYAPVPISTQGLVSYWKFDEQTGNAIDQVGGNTLTNNNVTYGDGKIGNGAILNGSSGYLSITNSNQKGLNITKDMTMAFWFKPADIVNTGRVLISKFDYASGNQRGYQLYVTNTFGLILTLSPDGGSDSPANFTYAMNANTWYFIVVIYNSNLGTVKMIVNNQDLGTATGITNSIYNCTADFRIGNNHSGVYAYGTMDEVSMWNRCLSVKEASILYNSFAGLQYPFGGQSELSVNDVYKTAEPETRTYYTNLINNGGTIRGDHLYYVNEFVKDLKRYEIWDILDDIGIFCGDNLAAALTKLKNSQGGKYLINHNFVEADYISSGSTGGLKGDGSTKFLDSLHNVSGLPYNNLSIGIYWNGTVNGVEIGEDNTDRFTLFPNGGNAAIATGDVYTSGRSIAKGFMIGTRSPGTNVSISFNGDFSTWATADITSSLYNETCYIFARNEGTNPANRSSNRVCYYHFGRGLSAVNCGNYYVAIQKLMTSLGRQA